MCMSHVSRSVHMSHLLRPLIRHTSTRHYSTQEHPHVIRHVVSGKERVVYMVTAMAAFIGMCVRAHVRVDVSMHDV